MIYYVYILIMTLMGSLGALFFKRSTSNDMTIKSLIINKNLYIGGGLYFISATLNIYVLKSMPYSVVLPLTSITYIWTMILSYFVLHEKISSKKIVGIILIILGAVALTL